MPLSGAVAHARWTGPDSERFRVQGNNGMRAQLNNAATLRSTNATFLKPQADEQTAAGGTGGGVFADNLLGRMIEGGYSKSCRVRCQGRPGHALNGTGP